MNSHRLTPRHLWTAQARHVAPIHTSRKVPTAYKRLPVIKAGTGDSIAAPRAILFADQFLLVVLNGDISRGTAHLNRTNQLTSRGTSPGIKLVNRRILIARQFWGAR